MRNKVAVVITMRICRSWDPIDLSSTVSRRLLFYYSAIKFVYFITNVDTSLHCENEIRKIFPLQLAEISRRSTYTPENFFVAKLNMECNVLYR